MLSANSNLNDTDHMIPTQTTVQTAVLTSTTSLSPTIDSEYYASPSYNTSYGEPGKFFVSASL